MKNKKKNHIQKGCDTKDRDETLEDAQKAVTRYYERVVISIDPVEPYKCDIHGCFHIGHQRPLEEIRTFNKMLKDIGYHRAA